MRDKGSNHRWYRWKFSADAYLPLGQVFKLQWPLEELGNFMLLILSNQFWARGLMTPSGFTCIMAADGWLWNISNTWNDCYGAPTKLSNRGVQRSVVSGRSWTRFPKELLLFLSSPPPLSEWEETCLVKSLWCCILQQSASPMNRSLSVFSCGYWLFQKQCQEVWSPRSNVHMLDSFL